MASAKPEKRHLAQQHLEQALAQHAKAKTDLNFLTVVKAFEILIEYEWRELKLLVESEGLEAQSPKMAVKQAAKLGHITTPETWLECIDARNNSVHDYFGILEDDYLKLAKQLLALSCGRK